MQECTTFRLEVNLLRDDYHDGKRYVIGVIGDIPALLTFWEMFKDQSNDEVLKEIGVVAAALPGETVLPKAYDMDRSIPTYAGFKNMLDAHPEINMVIEATGRKALVYELRQYLPPSITLVERGAANFFINLLSSNKLWVACKVDLLHTQNMLKTIIDQMDEEILFLDRDGNVMDANQTVFRKTGKKKRQLVGKAYCEIFTTTEDPECSSRKDPVRETVRTGEPSESLTSVVDGTGRLLYYRIYTQPIMDEDGQINHVVAMRRDITQRTSMEQRLQQAEKLASVGELSTYMAHEIRNPLFTISGFANSLVRSESIDEKAREKLTIILKESKRLDDVLRNLMNFTRPTSAQVSEVDINQLITATMDVMSLPCTNQNVTATIDLDPDLAKVKANPDLIKQCLINLVKNSLEAMKDGGKLLVSTTMNTEFVHLTVEDTGHGIPADIRDQVFSPFFSTKGKGAGLGLAQIHKIVDEIGGAVDLISKEHMGTKVILHLPPLLAVAEEDESE